MVMTYYYTFYTRFGDHPLIPYHFEAQHNAGLIAVMLLDIYVCLYCDTKC